jgi:chromosome segregation protein
MKPGRSDVRYSFTNPKRGFLGPALDLIEFDDNLRPALESLIGRVLICETLDDALELSGMSSGWSRIVTTTGEVVVPSGAITGGSMQRRGSSLLVRKTEINRLTSQLTVQQIEEDATEKLLARASQDLADADSCLSAAGEAAAEARLKKSAASQLMERAKRDHMAAADRSAAHNRRLETAMEGVKTADLRVEASRAIIVSLEDTEVSQVSGEDDDYKLTLAERETLRSEITQEQISRAALNEKSEGLSRALRLAESELAQLSSQRERRINQMAEVARDLEALTSRLEAMEAVSAESDQRMADANSRLQQFQSNRQTLAAEAAVAMEQIRDLQNKRAAALAAARKNELAEARYEIVRQQAAVKLLEEYDVTAEHALSLANSPMITNDGPREVGRLRRELRALGDVNVGAIEEFDRLSERFAYMTAQKNDAQTAKDKVYDAIREIDESTRDVFMSTFRAVGAEFQIIFQRLFNGGSAELKLTEPGDLLETGIDIFVQLPGKRQQSLQLLSGGERALTAVALLFAFLKVRPAPFCLLDEVDAPLDGANIERFAELLKEFGEKTQFLVITHNPATMEAAQVWYGVTMQEPGISRVLSLHVPEPVAAA